MEEVRDSIPLACSSQSDSSPCLEESVFSSTDKKPQSECRVLDLIDFATVQRQLRDKEDPQPT